MIQKGFKFRIYPNKEQEIFLMKSFGCVRVVYNWALQLKIESYSKTKKSPNYYDLNKHLNELKATPEKEWLKEVYSQSLQSALRHLDNAFTRFFKEKKGFPKYKSRHKNDFSFAIPQGATIYENKLYIPKVKQGIRIKLSRDFNGKIKTTTISKNPSGQYFVTLLIEENSKEIKPKKVKESTTIGIDLGIKDFAVLSTGEKIDNPRHLKKKLKKLKKIQQRHSRKQAGSNNRKKSRVKVAKIHNKISNQRRDFLHKLSHRLTHDKQVGTICIEDLAVKNMVRNRKLSQAIFDVGWGEFRRQLEYKSKWYGINLIVIGRFKPSSKLCNQCGLINSKLTLSDREWTCECGAIHDRDILAATNIRNFGLAQYRRNYGNSDACGEILAQADSLKQEAPAFRRG
jgi:putative transposase